MNPVVTETEYAPFLFGNALKFQTSHFEDIEVYCEPETKSDDMAVLNASSFLLAAASPVFEAMIFGVNPVTGELRKATKVCNLIAL